jgi:hypothetical protein
MLFVRRRNKGIIAASMESFEAATQLIFTPSDSSLATLSLIVSRVFSELKPVDEFKKR